MDTSKRDAVKKPYQTPRIESVGKVGDLTLLNTWGRRLDAAQSGLAGDELTTSF